MLHIKLEYRRRADFFEILRYESIDEIVIFRAPSVKCQRTSSPHIFIFENPGASEPDRIWSGTLGFIQSRLTPRFSYYTGSYTLITWRQGSN